MHSQGSVHPDAMLFHLSARKACSPPLLVRLLPHRAEPPGRPGERRDWKQLGTEQQTRLAKLGVTPAPQPAAPAWSRPRRASGSAFERGVVDALTRYK
ncbi:hypothetical protein [Streptomyces sp. A1136]|uniref:hypothetical protein n=1 Tax=Streptomyces sp. A1136 TaxID=2563102 RepID=UPI00109E6758|nr:hypothetical protein [Streptomyces sp. A1136]THA47084.1 hypothetical protein E6R62_31980 [Streptomyces sp. A1136]